MAVTSQQELSAYVIYMILGSYFKKAVCASTIKESQLRLAYLAQKRDNQINMEERCDNYVASRLIPNVPKVIFNDMVEVRFLLNNDKYIVEFTGFDWKINMWANQIGKSIMFNYEYKETEVHL